MLAAQHFCAGFFSFVCVANMLCRYWQLISLLWWLRGANGFASPAKTKLSILSEQKVAPLSPKVVVLLIACSRILCLQTSQCLCKRAALKGRNFPWTGLFSDLTCLLLTRSRSLEALEYLRCSAFLLQFVQLEGQPVSRLVN